MEKRWPLGSGAPLLHGRRPFSYSRRTAAVYRQKDSLVSSLPIYSTSALLDTTSPAGKAMAVKELARRHGFDLASIASPDLSAAHERYREWLARGFAGEMTYLARRPEVREDLRNVWPETRSALVVAMRYRPEETCAESTNSNREPAGEIACYAHGGDYHKFIKKRLIRVLRDLKEIDPLFEGRSYVDTGPILERDLAVNSGLGWAGKNSLLLSRELGSYFFIGTLLLNQTLPFDPPMAREHCGTCSQCIDDCPTGAIVAPNVVDSRRCISYLTIELRGPMPRDLRPLVGNHIFGCDICQAVCPWNDGAPKAVEPRFAPRAGMSTPNLHELILLDEKAFRERFKGTPVMRARYGGFLRNVAVAIGNTGTEASLYPLARGHAVWALSRIGARFRLERIRRILEARLYSESEEWVSEEIELALGEMISSWDPASSGANIQ
ncbi:MAG: tRNA epoxyqueuosine(34) reductase QueG [Nitrospinaceae bacterium]|nr:tRNA epoxyqueuosine(34) reductase QueG [Nitrospinaceae bacterium]